MNFVTKFSADGSQVVYSSYLGGTQASNYATSIAVDNSGSAWVTGTTQSGGFPVVGNAIQRILTSDQNGFVTKVSPDGSKLLYSTYLGGGSTDNLLGITVDGAGNAYVTGWTNSFNFPVVNASGSGTNNRVTNWTYDNVGNIMSIPTMQRTFSFDAENRQTSAVINGTGSAYTTTYTYDGDGRRITKSTGGALPTVYVYDPTGQLAAEYGPATDQESGTYYLTADALGSTRLQTNSSGVAANCYDYLPFGQELFAGTGARVAISSGGCFVPSPDSFNLKFTGKERDAESGLDWFKARYFSGAQGRFTSPDAPFNDQDPSDPQSWNLYSYVRNNPLRFTDPTGQACVQGSDGKFYDDNSGGQSCSDANSASQNNTPSVTVTAQALDPTVLQRLGLDSEYTRARDQQTNLRAGLPVDFPHLIAEIPIGPPAAEAATTIKSIWTSTNKLSAVKNAFFHWLKHGREFPNLENAKQYVEAAWDFVTDPPAGTLSKVRANGDTVLYEPSTNTFAVKTADGVPRTMFKPGGGMTYFNGQ
jgi:RHS repeat-associated protein